MKFKEYLSLVADPDGFLPLPRLRWIIRKNDRPTAREEAIVAKVIEAANPRSNITGHFPWGAEEQLVLQQFWTNPKSEMAEWRDVFTAGGSDLFSVKHTKHGPLPVPNAIEEPGMVRGDFSDRIHEALGDDYE